MEKHMKCERSEVARNVTWESSVLREIPSLGW